MFAFEPKGPLLSFTGATTAPTSVQAISLDGVQTQQYALTNTDQNNDCVIGWGMSDAAAKLNAAAGATTQKCYYLLARSQVVVTAQPGAYFSGITAASTAVIKVQSGIGL